MSAVHIQEVNFQEQVVNANRPVLVDYWAPWCSYCRRIGPALDKIAESREDILVVKVNIDEEPDLAQQERIEVIPTLVVYKGGYDLGSIVAPESKARIDAFLKEALEQ